MPPNFVALLGLFAAIFTAPAYAKPVSNLPRPTVTKEFLRIDHYYVLYTNPIIPHRDAGGHWIIGLDGWCKMMGASLDMDTQANTATMTWRGHILGFQAGSRSVQVDGKEVLMPVAAQSVLKVVPHNVGHHDEPVYLMLVPLSVFINTFHLSVRWDAPHHTLLLKGQNLMGGLDPEFPRMAPPDADTGQLVPIQIILKSNGYYLDLVVRNISGHRLPAGAVLTAPYFAEEGYPHAIFSAYQGPGDTNPQPAALEAGQSRHAPAWINLDYGVTTSYAVAWLIVLH